MKFRKPHFESLEKRVVMTAEPYMGHIASFFQQSEASTPIELYVDPQTRTLDVDRAFAALSDLDSDVLALGLWTQEDRSSASWKDFIQLVTKFQTQKPDIEIYVYLGSPSYARNGHFCWEILEHSDACGNLGSYTDYLRWTNEIANLTTTLPVIKGILLDDFGYDAQRDDGSNRLFTPQYIQAMRQTAINAGNNLRIEVVLYTRFSSAWDAVRFDGLIDAAHMFYRNANGSRIDTNPARIVDDIEMFSRAYSGNEVSPLATIYRPANRPAIRGNKAWLESEVNLNLITDGLILGHFDTIGSTDSQQINTGSFGWVRKKITLDGIDLYNEDIAADSQSVQQVVVPQSTIASLQATGKEFVKLRIEIETTRSYPTWNYTVNFWVRSPQDLYLDWSWGDSENSHLMASSDQVTDSPKRILGIYGGSPSFMNVDHHYTETILKHSRDALHAGLIDGISAWEVMMNSTVSDVFDQYRSLFAAVSLDQQFNFVGANSSAISFGGVVAKWFRNLHGAWFFITPTGDLFRWDGSSQARGELLGKLNYRYFNDISLITNSDPPPNLRLPDRDTTVAEYLSTKFGFRSNGFYYVNWGGRGEKWFTDRDGKWYFITPDGRITRWDLTARASGQHIATVSSRFHAEPQLLFDSQMLSVLLPIRWRNTSGNFAFNWGGQREKWLQTESGSWHYVLPDGRLFRWRPIPGNTMNGELIGRVGSRYYQSPGLLIRFVEDYMSSYLQLSPTSPPSGNPLLSGRWLTAANGDYYLLTSTGDFYRWSITRRAGSWLFELSSNAFQ